MANRRQQYLNYMQKNAILNYFLPRNVTSEAEGIARSILDNVLIDTVTNGKILPFILQMRL